MKKNRFLIIIMFALFSCTQKQKMELITQKIQYDVSIKSPDTSYDPWIQNIDESQRLKFVSNLLNAAYEGRIQAYDYFNQPISIEQLKSIGVDSAYRTLIRSTPPYAEYDTLIVSKIEMKEIVKIRFLEEWYMDEQNLTFKKVIIGIAPVVDKFDEEGNFIGLFPMFWIYPQGLEALKK